MLLAYSKMWLSGRDLVDSDPPERPVNGSALQRYFPRPLRQGMAAIAAPPAAKRAKSSATMC